MKKWIKTIVEKMLFERKRADCLERQVSQLSEKAEFWVGKAQKQTAKLKKAENLIFELRIKNKHAFFEHDPLEMMALKRRVYELECKVNGREPIKTSEGIELCRKILQ